MVETRLMIFQIRNEKMKVILGVLVSAVIATTGLPAMAKPIRITLQNDLAFGQIASNVSRSEELV